MKFFLICTFLVCRALTSPTIKDTCSNPIVKFTDINFSNGDVINKGTVMTVKMNTQKALASDAKAIVELSIKRKAFIIDIPIPKFLIQSAVSRVKMPDGIEFVEGSTFKVDCRAAKRFMPVCPPPVGESSVQYDFGFVLGRLEDKLANNFALRTLVKWFSKGNFRFSVDAKLESTGEKLACFESRVSIKL